LSASSRPRAGARGRRAGAGGQRARGPAAARALTAAEATWLAALPCALLTLLAIVALGPPLGRVLFAGHPVTFWPALAGQIHPEASEQARFLIAIAAPLLLCGATLWLMRRGVRLPAARARALVWGGEAALVAFALACLVAQRTFTFGPLYEGPLESFHQPYFSVPTLALAAAGAIALISGVRDPRVRRRFAAWAREARGARIGWTAAAALLIAVWLLHAYNTEATIGDAHYAAAYHLQFTLDETSAVLDGRTPLVNFAAQYGFLWPYPVAAGMALLGRTVGTFSALMCLVSGLAMLALYDTLRRASRSALAGLLLFAPVLATSWFLLRGPLDDRYTFATIFSAYPMRFAGPWLLAWLVARHLDGAGTRRAWPLLLGAGLVAMNNADHGVPALGAVLAALLWTGWRPTRAGLRRLAFEAAGGLLAAYALVSALTLARAGSLPDLALLLRFARLFASAGFAMLPMPTLGFQLAIYLTFVAAIGVATARALAGAQDRVLTGLLVWVGVFGLGAGSYYAGRSHPEVLVDAFGSWALATALLLVVVLRRLAAQPLRWPTPAEAACCFAFGLAACSLAQTPTPWSQLQRLGRATPVPVFRHPVGEAFVAAHAQRGEKVAILLLLGHRMGDQLGLSDVAPYTGSQSMPTVQQLDETLRALRDAGGRRLFLSAKDSPAELIAALRGDGFRLAASDRSGAQLWLDARRGG
jgi:hypothetical protein